MDADVSPIVLPLLLVLGGGGALGLSEERAGEGGLSTLSRRVDIFWFCSVELDGLGGVEGAGLSSARRAVEVVRFR